MADVNVLVAWVTLTAQDLVPVTLASGATAATAIAASGLPVRYGVDVGAMRIGINGSLVRPDMEVVDGDRVEIYRPLIADPKDVRRAKARIKIPASPLKKN